MTADLLRRAADKLDTLADAATDDPWIANSHGYVFGRIAGDEVAHTRHRWADAAYIAVMHPGVGKALAAWLREYADRNLAWTDRPGAPEMGQRAGCLSVARAILNESEKTTNDDSV